MLKKYLIIMFCCMPLLGCMTTTSLNFVDTPKVKSTLYDGERLFESTKRKTKIVTSSSSVAVPNERFFEIFLLAENKGHKKFIFSTENVAVSVNGKTAKIQTYLERSKEERTRAAWAAAAVALGGAAQAYSASAPQYTTGTFNSYSGGFGTYSGTTYNSAASAAAVASVNAQTTTQINTLQTNLENNLRNLKNSYLKPTDLEKGGSYGGKIRVLAPPVKKDEIQKISMSIKLGTEKHSFTMIRTFDEND